MAKLSIQVGSTSKTINVYIRSTITGEGLTGLLYNSSGLAASYTLPLSAPVTITLATQTVTGAWSSGGFVEIDSVKSPGLYRLDLPNSVIASGSFVDIFLLGANNMVNYADEIELTGWNAATGSVSSVTGNVAGSVGSVASRVTANTDEISGSATAATNLSISAQTMQSGAAVTGTLTSSVFTTNLVSTVTGAYVGRFILFTSGVLIQQAQTIAAYSNTGQITTIQPFTTAPSNTDTFVIV